MKKEIENLQSENRELKNKIQELEDTLNAIRTGDVDAIVLDTEKGEQIFSLSSTDTSYRVFIEQMTEGAAILSEKGLVFYCNKTFAEIFNTPIKSIQGNTLDHFFNSSQKKQFHSLIKKGFTETAKQEFTISGAFNEKTQEHSFLFVAAPFINDYSEDSSSIKATKSISLIAYNITSLKVLENQLKEHQKNLEKKVEEQTRELSASNQQLRAANQQLEASEQQLRATNQQLIEESNKLKSSEEELNTIFNTAADGMRVVGADFKIKKVNDTFCKMVGLSRDEIIGKNCYDIFWGEHCGKDDCPIKKLPKHSENRIELEVAKTGPNGKEISTIKTSTQLNNNQGDYIGIVQYYKDITERKQAETNLHAAFQQLQASEQQLRASNQQLEAGNQQLIASEKALEKEKILSEKIVETANAIIVGLDKDHTIRIFNRGAEQITGYKKEEVIGKDWFKIFFQNDILDEMNKVWKGAWGNTSHSYINPILAKSGEERVISWQTTGMFDSDDVSEHLQLSIGEDITERKQTEEKLNFTKDRLIEAQQYSKLGWWELDINENLITWSDELYNIFGITHDEDPLNFEKVMQLVHPDYHDYHNEQIELLKKTGTAVFEYPVKHQDGKTTWIWSRGKLKLDEDGNPAYMFGVTQDITERKKAEEALRQSEEKYRNLVENIADVVFKLDDKGNILYISPNMSDILGYDVNEIIARPFMEIIYPEDLDKSIQGWEQHKKGDAQLAEFRVLTRTGNYKWVAVLGKYNAVTNIVTGVLRDITERKQAEEKLKESEERLNLVIKGSNDAPWDWNLVKDELYYSPQWWAQIGYEPNEIAKDSQLWARLRHPDDIERVDNIFADALKNEDSYEVEFRLKHKNGNYVPVLSRGFVSRNEKGEAIRVSGTNLDLTERKKAEEILKDSENRLAAIFDNTTDYQLLLELGENNTFYVAAVNKSYINRVNKFGIPISKDNLLGKSFDELQDVFQLSKEEAKGALKNYSKVAETKEKLEFIENVKINNIDYYAEISLIPIVDSGGDCQYILYNSHEITDQKQAEKELKENEERFNLAMNASNDGLFDWNLETNEIYYSPAWKKMLGYEDHELQNDFSVWEKTTAPEDVKKSWELQQKLISKQIDRFELEFKMKHKEGHWVDILSRAKAVFDESGKAIRIVGTHTDIGVRKKAEEELIRVSRIMSNSQEIAHLGSFEYVAATQTTIWSEEEYRIYGLDPNGPSPEYNEMLEKFIHPDDAKLLHETFMMAINNQGLYELEHRIVRPNGSIRWVHDKAHPYFDKKGNLLRYVGATLDITERKQSEEKLKASEGNLKNTFNLSPSMIVKANLNTGFYIEANQAVTRILGYSIKEFTSIPYTDLVHPDDIPKTSGKVSEQTKGNEVFTFENRFICKDGSYTWLSWNATAADSEGIAFGAASDITERKKAEEELLKNQHYLKKAQEIGIIGTWHINVEKNTIIWTEENYKIFEVKDGTPINYELFINIVHPDDRAYVNKVWGNAVKGEPYDIEHRIIVNQKVKWVREKAELIFDSKGKVAEAFGVTQDITQQKKTEQNLLKAKEKAEESEAKFRSYVESAPDGIFIADENGKYLEVNKAACDTTGYSKEELVELSIPDLLQADHLEEGMKVFQKLAETGFAKNEIGFVTKSGENRFWNVSAVKLSDTRFLGFAKDITERKKAEEKLIQSESRYRQLVDTASDAIYLMDEEGTIIDTNLHATQMLQRDPNEIIGNPIDIVDPNFPVADFVAFWKGTSFDQQKIFETNHVRKNGESIPVEVSGKKFKIDDKIYYFGVARDITERKKAEEEIRKNEEFLSTIYQNSEMGVFVVQVIEKGEYIYEGFNPTHEKLMGMSNEEISGKSPDYLIQHLGEVAVQYVKDLYDECVESRKMIESEFYVPAGPAKGWWLSKLSPIIDKKTNKVIKLIGNGIIITQIKKAQEALKVSEEKYRLLHESAALGIGYYTPEGIVISYNAVASKNMGGKPEDFTGKSLFDLFPKDLAEEYFNRIQIAVQSNDVNEYEDLAALPNENKWFVSTYSKIVNSQNDILGIQIISQDITERKKANELIKLNEMHLSSLVENPAGYIVYRTRLNRDTGQIEVIKVSPDFTKVLGIPETDKENFQHWFANVYPDDLPKLMKANEEGMKPPFELHIEIRNKHPEKGIQWFDIRAQGIPYADNREMIEYANGMILDITERKQTEKALIESQRLNVMGEMAASVAHDFNNSLQAMIGNIEVVKFKSKLTQEAQTSFNNIEAIIYDTASRVQLLQNFGKPKLEYDNFKITNLNSIISETIIQLSPLLKDNLEKNGLSINVREDFDDVSEIKCNAGDIKTVFNNIIKNSIEAMPGGGELIIKTRKKLDVVIVTISDTGIGMDDKTKDRIFQPFFSTKGFDAGRGLGMSGAYNLVKEHGGNISIVKSELGKGTSIEIVFPLSTDEIVVKEEVVEQTASNNNSEIRVLWVEDDNLIRENAKEIVECMGYKCDAVSSGKIALEYLEKNIYDLIITDIGMSEMSGWQLVEIIRKKLGDKIKIAIVSGWTIDSKEKEEKKINYIIRKPFTIEGLKKILLDIQK